MQAQNLMLIFFSQEKSFRRHPSLPVPKHSEVPTRCLLTQDKLFPLQIQNQGGGNQS